MSDHEVRIVYFSSVSNNTERFAEKLDIKNERLPLKRQDPFLYVDYKYCLMLPTYGGGTPQGAVPKQVIKFLNEKSNRDLCVGVIATGNTNFGSAYLLGGKTVAKKLQVPLLYGLEMAGLDTDVTNVQNGLLDFYADYVNGDKKLQMV